MVNEPIDVCFKKKKKEKIKKWKSERNSARSNPENETKRE